MPKEKFVRKPYEHVSIEKIVNEAPNQNEIVKQRADSIIYKQAEMYAQELGFTVGDDNVIE